MQSYIIRIYRCGKGNPGTLVGVVEKVGVEGHQAFTGLHELWEILNPSHKRNGKRSPEINKRTSAS